ncbi:MAG: hypothetical protein Q8P41_10045 [Pseudomonadota bacterium]|nr:hypothetical protein [Pseudomonadota bacterium]
MRWSLTTPSPPASPSAFPAGGGPLVPRLGPLPSGFGWAALLMVLTAWVLLLPASASPGSLLPGNAMHPDLPGTVNFFWLVETHGALAATHSRLLMYPAIVDRVLMQGMPFDALAAVPLLALLGWPTGFVVFQVLVLAAAGAAMAWLGATWWRSTAAGLVAGFAWQSAGVFLRELEQGRPTHLFGAIFAPLAFGFFARALVEGRRRDAFLAGACTAASALAYWYWGIFCALALAVLWGLSLREGRAAVRVVTDSLLGFALIVGLPLAYTLARVEDQPAVSVQAWDTVWDGVGARQPLVSLLKERARAARDEGALGLRPLVLLLAVLGAWSQRRRRWIAAVALVVLGVALSAGPWWDLPWGPRFPAPFLAFTHLPLLRRLWWPERTLFVAALGVALLVGGGGARVIGWLAIRRVPPAVGVAAILALLYAEAVLVDRGFPLGTTPGNPSERALALAAGKGPVLILPQDVPGRQKEASLLIDQVFHGRATVNGFVSPVSSAAPDAYRDIGNIEVLHHLFQCENDIASRYTGDPAAGRARLAGLGVAEVYVDLERMAEAPRHVKDWTACVESLLGADGWEARGPYRVYAMEASSAAAAGPGAEPVE